MSGCVRNTVMTFMSSCEWCSSWKRQSSRERWFARCADQLQASMATKITAIARACGTKAILGRTIQGTTRSTTP